MQGDSNNPNEVILIPLLNKRVTDLYTQNILLEGKLLWAEREKEELQQQLQAASGNQSAAVTDATTRERAAAEREKQEIISRMEAEKRAISENWEREAETRVGVVKTQLHAMQTQFAAATQEIAKLKAELAALRPPVEEKTPPTKRKSKKEPVVLGGDTY